MLTTSKAIVIDKNFGPKEKEKKSKNASLK